MRRFVLGLVAGFALLPACSAPEPTPIGTRHSDRDCPGDTTIAPPGAHYCFTVPAGFSDATASSGLNAGSAQPDFFSAISVTARDFIFVMEYSLGVVNSEEISSAELGRATLRQNGGAGETADELATAERSIDGARTFTHGVRGPDYAATMSSIYRGHHRIVIICQSVAREHDIERGCADVHAGIRVAG